MTTTAPQLPDWQLALQREARIRSGLVLYGNTRDVFFYPESRDYLTLSELVSRRLGRAPSSRFTLTAVWDQADGLRFSTPAQARRWEDIRQRRLGSGPGAGTPYDVGEEPEAPGRGSGTQGERVPLRELIPTFRQILADGSECPLLVVDWSHLLVTQPAHPAADEREWMLTLGKALVGEAIQPLDSDRLKRGTGLLVLIAASLGALPPSLYQGEPRVRLLDIPSPTRSERRAFFLRHADELRCARPRPAPGAPAVTSREAVADPLADLTEQLTTADLRQVLSLSRTTPDELPPDRLFNLYRIGDQRSPWEELSADKLREVEAELRKRVVGQDGAVRHMATLLIRAWLGLAGLQHSARRSKPKGTLFFVGPTGVGKTELAKACAAFLFGDESACIRFDMSEYNHEHSDQRLVGAPPGYVGFEEGGQLTNAVTRRPFSVLLFDEVEKAHGRVLDKFLQVLEDGRLTDGRGETAWFSETVIIFTSNLGAADAPGPEAASQTREAHFRQAVEEHFVRGLKRPELLNRLGDNIVVFHPIADEAIRRGILQRKLEPLREHLRERWGVELRLEAGVEDWLVRTARTDHGGRGLLNALERELVNPLARFLFDRHHQLRKGRTVTASSDGPTLAFDLE
ncbi:AAA family ATPase [Myxococcus sp. AS-1-15]|uniref:AAA family ATPase n=1 Tax=Myxococcus TaxID=32 RepID=UPI001CBD24D2|nr:AAA family ATPase [Myxococcus sp. AS-1-15]MBZ4402220.1 AAA family ATPase [Myxococcus sp. AS-1-15]